MVSFGVVVFPSTQKEKKNHHQSSQEVRRGIPNPIQFSPFSQSSHERDHHRRGFVDVIPVKGSSFRIENWKDIDRPQADKIIVEVPFQKKNEMVRELGEGHAFVIL